MRGREPRRGRLARLFLAGVLLCLPSPGRAQVNAMPSGDAAMTATVSGTSLPVFTHRPERCAPRLLLMVFHGVGRNAADYRDDARPLADRLCAIVVAPLFDRARFPRDRYQYGGVRGAPAGQRTVDLVAPLADWARAAAGAPGLKLVLLGHSAGAQFADRVAAFAPGGVAGFVIANPSTWVWPSLSVPAPFGFGGAGDQAALRTYLGLRLTVLLGAEDHKTAHLAMSARAMAQGADRFARGEGVFAAARSVALAHGWAFGWRLAVVPGVGHDARRMFASEQALAAVP